MNTVGIFTEHATSEKKNTVGVTWTNKNQRVKKHCGGFTTNIFSRIKRRADFTRAMRSVETNTPGISRPVIQSAKIRKYIVGCSTTNKNQRNEKKKTPLGVSQLTQPSPDDDTHRRCGESRLSRELQDQALRRGWVRPLAPSLYPPPARRRNKARATS